MTATDKPRLVLAAGLAILFAVALWLRVSSLGAFPWHNADESYYGVQTARLLRGEAFAFRTMNHNIINPFLIALQGPFHLVSRPSVWVLRAPAALCGILAVILTYVIGVRVLDRGTAQIATVLMATLPSAIYQSRVGLEMSQLPLFSLVVIAFALRGHGPGLLVSFLASMLVHPPAIFLIPIALPIFLVQLYRKGEDDPIRRRRMFIGSTVVSLVVVAAVSFVIFKHPMAQMYLARRPPLNWRNFLDGYERFLFFLYGGISIRSMWLHRWIFRAMSLTLLVLGTGCLVRKRQWERLALIAGLAASLVVFHFVAGPRMLRMHATHRYGVVFILPTTLAFACLMQSLLPAPSTSPGELPGRAMRRIPLAVALILGWALLLSIKQNQFDPIMASLRESLWTFHPDGEDEYERALSLIRRESTRSRAGEDADVKPIPIIVQDYWSRMPLAYLSSASKDLEVVPLIDDQECRGDSVEDITRKIRRELPDRLRAGAYVVENPLCSDAWRGRVIQETLRASCPRGHIRRWEVPSRRGTPALIVYRIEEDPAPIASTVDPSGVRRNSTIE